MVFYLVSEVVIVFWIYGFFYKEGCTSFWGLKVICLFWVGFGKFFIFYYDIIGWFKIGLIG